MTLQPINTSTRLGAMLLDHIIMCCIITLFFLPQLIVNIADPEFTKVTHEQSSYDLFQEMSYFVFLGFALYFCKDAINGRSLAKRVLHLQVVDNKTGSAASPMQCFVRNIFCILWPIEVLTVFFNPTRRIGDKIAGTRVARFNPEREQPTTSILQVFLSLIVAIGMIAALIALNPVKSFVDSNKVKYVESSYNASESKELQRILNDSLRMELTTDVRVYDRIGNTNKKYISVLSDLRENYIEDHEKFVEIRSTIMRIVRSKYQEKTYLGQLKFVVREPGKLSVSTIEME